DASRMIAKINYTRGVSRVLGTECGPTPVDDSIIALIRSRVDSDGCVRPALTLGDRVRIIGGPLKDLEGVFSATLSDADRLRVLLTAVNGRFKVVLNADCLEPLS